jgi:hypothetical protein
MTNLTGKWVVAETMQFNDETCKVEWVSAEKILAKDDLDKDMIMLLKTIVVFQEDGAIDFLCPLPEGVSQAEIDAAIAAGKLKLKDGMMVMDQKHWKEENGKIMADTGAEGEVFGEKVGPWEELKVVDGGMIEMMMYRLKKAE